MNRSFVVRIAILIVCTACTSPSNEHGARASETQTVSSPIATSYRVDCELFELPLAIAEELYGHSAGSDSTLGSAIDASRCREALDILQPTNSAIVRSTRPSITIALGELAHIAPRSATSTQPAGSLAADHLELALRARPSSGWTPIDLETQIRWTDASGRMLGRLPSSTSPLPPGERLVIVCLPSKPAASESRESALFAFITLTPVH